MEVSRSLHVSGQLKRGINDNITFLKTDRQTHTV